jgi:hypothetical protein
MENPKKLISTKPKPSPNALSPVNITRKKMSKLPTIKQLREVQKELNKASVTLSQEGNLKYSLLTNLYTFIQEERMLS